MQRTLIALSFFLASLASANEPQKFTLASLIQRTLEHHPSIAEAQERLGEADARFSIAKAGLFPQLSLEANVGTFHDRVPNPGEDIIPLVGRDRNRYVGKITLVQPLFRGFGLWNAVKYSKSNTAMLRAALETQTSIALQQMLRAYFEVQVKREELQARKEAKSFHENQLKQTEFRYSQGRATRLQLLEARYVADTEEPVIANLQGEIEDRLLEIAGHLKLENPQSYEFSDSIDDAMKLLQEAALPSPEEAAKMLAGKNPELREARMKVEVKEAESGLLTSDDLPSLDFHLSAGTDSYLRQDIATSDTLFYSGELRLKVPLFSGLSSIYERRAGNAVVNAERKSQQKLETGTLQRLLASYHNWRASTKRIEVAKKEVEFMQEKFAQTSQRYQAGRSTLSDNLEAYSELLEAKKKRGDAVIGKILALTEIRAALGWFSVKSIEGENGG